MNEDYNYFLYCLEQAQTLSAICILCYTLSLYCCVLRKIYKLVIGFQPSQIVLITRHSETQETTTWCVITNSWITASTVK